LCVEELRIAQDSNAWHELKQKKNGIHHASIFEFDHIVCLSAVFSLRYRTSNEEAAGYRYSKCCCFYWQPK
jgi:hypothetical protein